MACKQKAEVKAFAVLSSVDSVDCSGMRGRFLHGVASGDPLPDAIILWTRLTPIEQTSEVP